MEGILEGNHFHYFHSLWKEFEARLFVNSILDTIINDITKADIKEKEKIDSTTDSLIDHVEEPQIQKEVVEDHSNSNNEAEATLKNLNDNFIGSE